MKVKARRVVFTLAGALLLSTSLSLPEAMAQQSKEIAATEAIADAWWFHGYIEIGGRFFLNNPEKGGTDSLGGRSLAKFYEYRDLRPGPFGDFHLATGTNNGLYQVDVWGKNVGYNDQRFNLDASKVGEHYFSFQWDETQHLYSDSAQTIYNGIGTNNLTLPGTLAAQLFAICNPCNANLTPAQAAAVRTLLNSFEHQTDIGIRRDSASVEYRWTPTEAWDVRVNYDHTHRWGTQVDAVVYAPTPSGPVSQVVKPVDDVTQNFGLSGEYQGTSPWGQLFTLKAGYTGSVYTDANNSFTSADPFCPATAGAIDCARAGAHSALTALWPNNQANGFSVTLGANLPMQSRYMGTMSYTMMRQNDAFLPFTNNTGLAFLINGQNPASLAALPASSLNGAINTFLSNNVLTTQLTPELKSKLAYRYYDFQNDTPELYFSDWVLTDSRSAAITATYAPVRSLSVGYTKQNGEAELNWRPDRTWNLGGGYFYERYDWTRADVNVTNEHSGKVYFDYKPWVWLTARASALFGERRYDNYDFNANVGNFQWINAGNTRQSTAMRAFYLNNRDRTKMQFSVAIDVIRGMTLTPTFGYQDDVYEIDAGQVGLTRSQSWTAGIDLAYMIDPRTRLLFSYMNEQADQNLRSTGATNTGALTAANTYTSPIKDRVNTFIGAVDFAAIPDKLNLNLSYTVALSRSSQPVYFDNGTAPGNGANFSQYPDMRGTWQRIEATATYKFDKETVQQLGWKGDVTAKLRYAWERNSVDNWQDDLMQTYMYTTAAPGNGYGLLTWLAYDNPNYNVHLLMASLSFKW